MDSLTARVTALIDWYQSTRIGRTLARMGTAQGSLLAGGIAYAALFSLAAALVIGWSVFMAVLGSHDELRQAVIAALDDALPGVVGEGSGYLLHPEDLQLPSAITPASVVSTVVLLLSALSVMSAIRTSIQQVFGIVAVPENAVLLRARDLATFIAFGLSILLTAALSIGISMAGRQIFDALNVSGTTARLALQGSGILAAFAVDFGIFVMLMVLLAGARPPRRDLLLGAGLGAAAFGVLRYLGTAAVSLPSTPIATSFTVLITLLLWVNLGARIILYVAAFTANPPRPVTPKDPAEVHFRARPNYVTLSAPATLQWKHQPTTGTMIPDPTLNPDAPPPPAAPEPRWGGAIGWCMRARISRLERALRRARKSYYG